MRIFNLQPNKTWSIPFVRVVFGPSAARFKWTSSTRWNWPGSGRTIPVQNRALVKRTCTKTFGIHVKYCSAMFQTLYLAISARIQERPAVGNIFSRTRHSENPNGLVFVHKKWSMTAVDYGAWIPLLNLNCVENRPKMPKIIVDLIRRPIAKPQNVIDNQNKLFAYSTSCDIKCSVPEG